MHTCIFSVLMITQKPLPALANVNYHHSQDFPYLNVTMYSTFQMVWKKGLSKLLCSRYWFYMNPECNPIVPHLVVFHVEVP